MPRYLKWLAVLAGLVAIGIIGCARTTESTTEALIGVWQMDKITKTGQGLEAEQHLKRDGSFEMRGTVPNPTGPITFVVKGVWRADSDYFHQMATNAEPDLGFPLNVTETHTLISVGASKFSMRTAGGQVRTFRRKK